MNRIYLLIIILLTACSTRGPGHNTLTEKERWEQHASNTEIIRDDFDVPHIYGKTDADAVFGLLYAQCEDDFNRVERNYIWATGRLAEAEGESALYSDLRAKLFMTQKEAEANYEKSPAWLKKLCLAFADGINFYLAQHPEVKPKFAPSKGNMKRDSKKDQRTMVGILLAVPPIVTTLPGKPSW